MCDCEKASTNPSSSRVPVERAEEIADPEPEPMLFARAGGFTSELSDAVAVPSCLAIVMLK